MNKLIIIGNLTRDPEVRTTASGKTVTTFTVAVDRRKKEDGTDFFRVSAWNALGEVCGKYLSRGRKVAVVGRVKVDQYMGNDGKTHSSLEVMADDVEFVSSMRQEGETEAEVRDSGSSTHFTEVNEELPF